MDIPERIPNASVGKPYECAVGRVFRDAVPAERLEVIVPEEVGLNVDGERVHGTPMVAGEYQVIVQPPLLKESGGGVDFAHKGVPPITLPKHYKVEAKANLFKIEVP